MLPHKRENPTGILDEAVKSDKSYCVVFPDAHWAHVSVTDKNVCATFYRFVILLDDRAKNHAIANCICCCRGTACRAQARARSV